MIAVDSNVLLRYLLRDDAAQSARAHRLFRESGFVLLTDVVLTETIWTLLGRRYRVSKSEVVSTVEKLLGEANVRFEDDQVIWRALQAYRRTTAGFADALIVYKARAIAAAHDSTALDAVFTFDQAAMQLPHTRSP